MDIKEFLCSYVDSIIAFIAIVVSIFTAIRQAKLEKKLALFDKRANLIQAINKDEIIDELDIELLFPKCKKEYYELIKAKQEYNNLNSDLNEYLDYYAEEEGISREKARIYFQLAEIEAEESGDYESFKKHCEEREIKYYFEPEERWIIGNYEEITTAIGNANKKYMNRKNILLTKMKKKVRTKE